jgi:SulP family sulfate permease
MNDRPGNNDPDAVSRYTIPGNVEIFEITGPLFFGAAWKFKEAIKIIEKPPRVLIIRMRQVPMIDATGIHVLREVYKEARNRGTTILLSGVNSNQVMKELTDSQLLFNIGKENVLPGFKEALQRCNCILKETPAKP